LGPVKIIDMIRKPVIIGIKSYKLTQKEKKVIRDQRPWGIILFQRNIKSFEQVKKLTNEIRNCIRDPYYPIMIDEEGGKVSRFSKLVNTKEFSQKFFGSVYEKDFKNGKNIYEYYLNSICSVLKSTGININTVPVMDLLHKSTHKIIKDRSYSKKINTIKSLGRICINILKKNKIASVAKHIPGHGKTNTDSHLKKPIIYDNLKKLNSNDFSAFKNLNSHFVMTAHVLYKKIDPLFVATQSKIIIKNIVRNKLKFKGLIISDDICMRALKGDLIFNAKKTLESGCNLILYCRANINEASKILKSFNKIDKFTLKKTQQLYQFLR